MNKAVSAVISLLLGATAVAQQPQQGNQPAPQPSGAASVQNLPLQMERFQKMVLGSWRTSETYAPSNSRPNGATGKGTAHFQPGPGGYSVIEDYRAQNPHGDFANHSVYWWDAKAAGIKAISCESTSPDACETKDAPGKWDGSDFVFLSEEERHSPNGPRKVRFEERYTNITPTHFTYKFQAAAEGQPFKTLLTIEHDRVEHN